MALSPLRQLSERWLKRAASERLFRLHQRDTRGAIKRETICAGADAREGDGPDGVTGRQFQAVTVAACQEIVFAARAVLPDGTDGVDDPFGQEVVTFRNLRLPGRTTAERAALFQ